VGRPLGSLVDPGFDGCDLLGLERLSLATGRHSRDPFGAGHSVDQKALGAFSRLDRGTAFAAAPDRPGRVKPHSRALFERSVTGVTGTGQNGLDVTEVVDLFGVGRWAGQRLQEQNHSPHHRTAGLILDPDRSTIACAILTEDRSIVTRK